MDKAVFHAGVAVMLGLLKLKIKGQANRFLEFTINNLTECIWNASDSDAIKTCIMGLGTDRGLHHAVVAVIVRFVMDLLWLINIFFSNSGLLGKIVSSVLTATKSMWIIGLGLARVDTQEAILGMQLKKKSYNMMKKRDKMNKVIDKKMQNTNFAFVCGVLQLFGKA